jgi:DNA-binding transcriptional MerR regulator
MDLSIGDAARLTGLSVRTIRYYSDIGLVPEVSRSDGRYRRYDAAGIARLELVRALRELGLDLASVRRVVQRPLTLAEVARAHADAVDAHIRQLTLRRAVLRAIARGTSGTEEVQRMTRLARASAGESRRIIEDFLDEMFGEPAPDPVAEKWRSAAPGLPDEPSDAQIDAWVELAALVQDPAFRARIREMVTEGAQQRASGATTDLKARRAPGQALAERAGAAVTAGVAPGDPAARETVDTLAGLFAEAAGREDTAAYRGELAAQIDRFGDRRVERYWQLAAILNGWPARPPLTPAYEWFGAALRVQPAP